MVSIPILRESKSGWCTAQSRECVSTRYSIYLRALKERIRFFHGSRTPPCWITDVTTEFARIAGSNMDAAGGFGHDQFGYGLAIALNDDLFALIHSYILVTFLKTRSSAARSGIGSGEYIVSRWDRPFRKPAQRGACKTDAWLIVAARSCRLALSIPA